MRGLSILLISSVLRAFISLLRFISILSVEITADGIIFLIPWSTSLLLASRRLSNFCMLILYIAILMKTFLMIFLGGGIFSIPEVEMLFFSFDITLHIYKSHQDLFVLLVTRHADQMSLKNSMTFITLGYERFKIATSAFFTHLFYLNGK